MRDNVPPNANRAYALDGWAMPSLRQEHATNVARLDTFQTLATQRYKVKVEKGEKETKEEKETRGGKDVGRQGNKEKVEKGEKGEKGTMEKEETRMVVANKATSLTLAATTRYTLVTC